MTTIKYVCAWCRRHLHGKYDAETVTHAICLLCLTGQVVLHGLEPHDPWAAWQDVGGEG
jgi:hypothetical protein